MTVKRYHEMGVTSCTATVLDCKALNDGNFDILLDETAIYPEGGGQLSDTGYIGSARVLHARDDGGYVWHTCDRAVAIGSKVDVKADKDVRLDHTQQHTGEHMLSGIAHTLFGCTNVGFHMAEDIVTVDFDKQLTQEQIDELELRVNEAIQRNEPTVIRTVSPEEYETIDIRKKAKGLKGEITIVYAGGVDSCTCCGTHCERAGEVGLLKIQSHTNYKGGTRIYFNCGMRAVISMQQDNASMDTIARRFSTSADRAVNAVIKQGDELADIKKELKRRTDALFAYRADELYTASDVTKGVHAIVHIEQGIDMNELGMLGERICANRNAVAVLFTKKPGQLSYRVMRSKDVSLSMRELIQAINAMFNGKGGGRDDSAQGSAELSGSHLSLNEALEQLRNYLKKRLAE